MKRSSILSRVLAVTAVTAGMSAQAEVASPWLASDRTVDCSSYETIKKDLKIDEMKKDEDKAISLFHFFRQHVFHYQNTPESRDPIKNLNVLGYTLCGSQGTCMKGLLGNVAGIKGRIRSMPGHTFYDAFYDGKWHGYDTFDNFYIFTRGENRNVASFEELKADPSLIKDAEKEGRAVPNMCPCGDDPMAFTTVNSEQDYTPLDLKYSPRNFNLRAGEEIVRSWWPDGKGIPSLVGMKYGLVALHTCGSRDRKDNPVLFKYWEPYGIPQMGGMSMSYRHTTSGQINYAPDLTNGKFVEGGVTATGLTPTADGLTGKGELIIPVNSPYYINSGVLVIEATCPGEGDSVTASMGKESGKWGAAFLTAKGATKKQFKGRFDESVNTGILHKYWVKIAVEGKAVVHHVYLRTGFQYNAQSAPNLMPGKNTVTFTAGNAEALKDTPVTIVYRYREAPKWAEEKRIEKVATSSPFTFDVTLPDTGDKLPQMLDLTWTCGKLAWVPGSSGVEDRAVVDFSKADAVAKWNADKGITLSHDGTGMLLAVEGKSGTPQASLDYKEAVEDWSNYKTIVIEVENLGDAEQTVVFRARSDKDGKERTDINQAVAKGKNVLRIPVAALNKTKVNAINKIYLLFMNIPDSGSKIRVNKISLEAAKEI